MELPVVNHKDYVAKIDDDHKFPIKKFGELAKNFNGISYALGGVKIEDLSESINHGGTGISGISCFF